MKISPISLIFIAFISLSVAWSGESEPRESTESPLHYVKDNGHIGLRREPDIDKDFTQEARDIFGADWITATRFIYDAPEQERIQREKFVLTPHARSLEPRGIELEGWEIAVEQMSKNAAMSKNEYLQWQERSPKQIANQITDQDLMRLATRPKTYDEIHAEAKEFVSLYSR